MAKKETFPKVAAETKIKGVELTTKGTKVKFDGLLFSEGQRQQLEQMLLNTDEVRVTIQTVQGRLPEE